MNNLDSKSSTESESQASPRAFCHATGFIFQSVGFLLTISTCCLWSLASWWQDELRSVEIGRIVPELTKDATPAQAWAMVAVVLTFVAGMGLLVVGLGLQHDRRGAGRSAVWLSALVALFFWCYLGFAIFQFPAVGRVLIVGIMAVLWTICFLLAGASAEQLKKFPPPKQSEPAWTSHDEDDLRRELSPHSQDKTNP